MGEGLPLYRWDVICILNKYLSFESKLNYDYIYNLINALLYKIKCAHF